MLEPALVQEFMGRMFSWIDTTAIMAAAASTTIVQVDEIVPLGSLDPEVVVTPGIFVDRVVAVGERAWTRGGEFVGGVDIEGRLLPPADAAASGEEDQ